LNRISASSREKLYLLLTFISLILLFISILQIRPVIVETSAAWGLGSYLPVYFWLGLGILILVSVCAFLDRGPIHDITYLVILIAVGLFLFGIGVFAFENPRIVDAYWPTSEANILVQQGHMDITTPTAIGAYNSWPAIHFFTASILEVCGISLDFIRYMPLVFMLILICLTYGIGKRLALNANQCFLFGFLVLSSWMFISHYGPNTIGMLFYMVMFLLLFNKQTVANSILCILTFGALVLTHGLTSIVVLLGLAALCWQRKEWGLLPLFVVIFMSWYMLQAIPAMERGIQTFWALPFKDLFAVADTERYQVVAAGARLVSRYSREIYLVVYALFVVGSLALILVKKYSRWRRKLVLLTLSWSMSVALIVALEYGGHVINRAYLYVMVPVALITALAFWGSKLMRVLIVLGMCVTAACAIPANYAVEASWGQVLTTELKGSEYFANIVHPQTEYFYEYVPNLIRSFNLGMSSIEVFVPQSVEPDNPGKISLTALDELSYIVLSKEGDNAMVYQIGYNPFSAWPLTSEGMKAGIFYDNGSYRVYVGTDLNRGRKINQ
jgi:hypothetical protein